MGTQNADFEGQTEERDFNQIPAKVRRVIFDGVGKTKEDILVKTVQPIFSSNSFQEMIKNSHLAKIRLEKLGLFKEINIMIDTCKDVESNETYDVSFAVEERKRPQLGVRTEVGGNDVRLVGRLKYLNVLGRGEEVTAHYSRNLTQNEDFGFHFQKPINGNPDVRLGTNVYQGYLEFPWSSFKEISRGTAIDLMFPSRFGSHNLKWEGVWRDMRALNRNTSFAVREQSGHSLKSSIKHTLTKDSRDDTILPTVGSLIKLTQEYAGIGGNVEFIKNDVELQYNLPLILDSVLQFSFAAGILTKIDKNKEIRINDRFFLGGPLTLRGFTLNGVGPHADGNALGADTYWLSGLHLYSPLPFRPGRGGFGELFRSHFFITAGNLGNINTNQTVHENLKSLSETLRLSYGLGVVLRLGGIARLEVNYVIPIRFQPADSVDKGFQFGVGLSFL